ncbi:hypothetical protein AZE42_08769 [Rhizopogon vesiculosus]|uniref:Uncharacterized protein n=1 Tax=Rhizopogon vesiculosus TaxID=180088 RepID=A0A1J8QCN3_9AGAM|nr:hypothetical protein AZE42_08769 [Rhizopogon vesiculosus]
MAESETQVDFTEPQIAYQENKEGSAILEEGKHPDLPSSSQDEFPEGGLAAWATAIGSFLVIFCTLGYSLSFGVYQGIAVLDTEWSVINLILALQTSTPGVTSQMRHHQLYRGSGA